MIPHGMLQQWIFAHDQRSLIDLALPELALLLNADQCWLFNGREDPKLLDSWPSATPYDKVFGHCALIIQIHQLTQDGIWQTFTDDPTLQICRLSGSDQNTQILVWKTNNAQSKEQDSSTQICALLFFGQLLQKHQTETQNCADRAKRDLQEAMLAKQLNDLRNQVNTIRELQQLMSAMVLCRELDELYQLAVEQLRCILPGCRSALMLYDPATGQVQGTFGTDSNGNTADERSIIYSYRDQT
ncbi:MAG: hypothetical protein ACRC5U_01775, partial [Plesiomonas sp.]